MTASDLREQHTAERAIRGDGCPADLAAFAREVRNAPWRYGHALRHVVAEAAEWAHGARPQRRPWVDAPAVRARSRGELAGVAMVDDFGGGES